MGKAPDLKWRAARGFLRDYRRASPPLQGLAEREVQHMQAVAASRVDWPSEWAHVRGIPGQKVLELELGGGPRLLAHVGPGTVTLLTMGDHEVTGRYASRGTLRGDLARTEALPPAFVLGHESFFPPPPDPDARFLRPYWPERSPDWLYFLDDEQTKVCDE